jgi:hypothetical protein
MIIVLGNIRRDFCRLAAASPSSFPLGNKQSLSIAEISIQGCRAAQLIEEV